MKAFTLTPFGLALSAALGALASPANPGSHALNDLDVRNENNHQVQYDGVSLRAFGIRDEGPDLFKLGVRTRNQSMPLQLTKWATGYLSLRLQTGNLPWTLLLQEYANFYTKCTDAIENKDCYFDSYTRKCVCQDVVD